MEAHTIERDLDTGVENVTTQTMPFEIIMKNVGSMYGTPALRVNSSLLQLRGDPFMDPKLAHRVGQLGTDSKQMFQ